MSVAAIIPAAGIGNRFGEQKQFKLLKGKPLFHYAIETFLKVSHIKQVLVVVPENQLSFVEKYSKSAFKVNSIKVIIGGSRRQDSVKKGIDSVEEYINTVCIHDAARPFISKSLIEACINASSNADGAIIAVQPVDTVKFISNGKVKDTLNRENIWLAQTPQVFNKEKLIRAFKYSEIHHLEVTDESTLMEKAGFSVIPIEGSLSNFKITKLEDWVRAERQLK